MYHKKSLRHNDEIRDNISDMQFLLHNITHEKIHKYTFILFLSDLCSNISCVFFIKLELKYLFIHEMFSRDSLIPKRNVLFVLWNDFLFKYIWQGHL